MKLTFLGANHEVTGSSTLLEIGGKYALIDCGMEQGENIFENTLPPISAGNIDYVFLTHAHIDHSGNLPLLYKQGFRGHVYATKETCQLCNIMLRDSAHIQMMEAEWKSRKSQRAGGEKVVPVYDMDDVEGLLPLLRPCDYATMVTVNKNITLRFTDIGHLLGSACIEVWLKEGDTEKKVVFSGDVGNYAQPIINNPKTVESTDYLMIESTYGDRLHGERISYEATRTLLAGHIQRALDRGGNLIIPSFAVGRTQEMLYFIRDIKNRGLVKGHDGFPVYVDSPLANEATAIFLQCDVACFDEETRAVMAAGDNPLVFPGLRTSVSAEDSKLLNTNHEPKVIISASGMCNAGRVRHHLKHNLWRPESLILFVGYQAVGTPGRQIIDGAESIKLFGEEISIKAEIAMLPGVSGHADKNGLLGWIDGYKQKPSQIFVNHGDNDACIEFTRCLNEDKGLAAFAPYSGTEYDMAQGRFLKITEGVPVVKHHADGIITTSSAGAVKTPFARSYSSQLEAAAEHLLKMARNSDGLSNKELKKLLSQVDTLAKQMKR